MRLRRSGDINYKERLDSCQKQMALLGKGRIFQPLMFCHFVFSCLANLYFVVFRGKQVLFSENDIVDSAFSQAACVLFLENK